MLWRDLGLGGAHYHIKGLIEGRQYPGPKGLGYQATWKGETNLNANELQ